MRRFFTVFILICISILVPSLAFSDDLAVGDPVPLFSLKNQDGVSFSMAERKGKGWTVLYFYPKAGTPGCTAQACAFRDSIDKLKALNAEVYGISSDTVTDQKEFYTRQLLKFDLLADDEMSVIRQFNAGMPLLSMARRWTFIIDPELIIRSINKDVDPINDAAHSVATISAFQHSKP